jgi:hypothetical protein
VNKIYYTWKDFDKDVVKLFNQITKSKWIPDYLVGITRGGLPLGVSLSNYMDIPLRVISISLRDHVRIDMDKTIADDAFGWYNAHVEDTQLSHNNSSYRADYKKRSKKILICDDINDSGATFNYIIENLPEQTLPSNPRWNDVWNDNVRFATLWNNPASFFQRKVDYTIHNKDPLVDPWVVFPWEEPFVGKKNEKKTSR